MPRAGLQAMGHRLIAITVATILAGHAQAQSAGQGLQSRPPLFDRGWADGAGPSHLVDIGPFLLVVDPRQGEIRRYAASDLSAAPARCTIPRDFAPWRSVRGETSVRLVAEPYGPAADGTYSLSSRRTMVVDLARVRAMGAAGPCGFETVDYDPRRDAPLRLSWTSGERPGSSATVRITARSVARVDPQGGRRAQIFAVRQAGSLSGGRAVLWWSEIDAYPIGRPTARRASDPPGFGGRVTASQYVGVFGPSGGRPVKVVRIRNASYGPLASVGLPDMSGVGKLGFETAVAGTEGGSDTLFVLAMDMADPAEEKPFKLFRYPLGNEAGATSTIYLTRTGASSGDREDGASTDAVEPSGNAPAWQFARTRTAWFDKLRPSLQRQVSAGWTLTAEAISRPCGGADECAVAANAQGALGTGAGFAGKVADEKNRGGGARWMRPTQLNGIAAGTEVHGVPYSIGNDMTVGGDPARDFKLALQADYGAAPKAFPRPVGHIREGMSWTGRAGNYPLGVDCAALVARIFGIGWRPTDELLETVRAEAGGGTVALPQGPARGCPQPVRHFSEIQPGDLLLRSGHVVIFSEIARIGGVRGGSLGVRVFEASSRCGRVCESVYDPTFFDGWWILRLRMDKDDDRDCPRWVDAAAAADPTVIRP